MPPDTGDLSTLIIAISIGVAVLVTLIVVVWFSFRFRHGDAATRRRRKGAILDVPIEIDAPFEVSCIGQGRKVAVSLDLDFQVPWSEISATVSECGITLDLELMVDGRSIEKSKLRLPDQRFPRNSKGAREILEVGGPSGSRSRCTSLISWVEQPAGAKITVRGKAEALPENEVRSLRLWVG